jgi:hypothetical protein
LLSSADQLRNLKSYPRTSSISLSLLVGLEYRSEGWEVRRPGMYEREIAEALRCLGLKGTERATPELIEKAKQFIYLQQRIHAKRAEAKAYHDRVKNFSGAVSSFLQSIAPPPRPVRDILEEALTEVHIRGRAIRGLFYRPWNVVMDFAFPATRLCLVLDDIGQATDRLIINRGWNYLPLKEADIRRNPVNVALEVKEHYHFWSTIRSRARTV